MTSVNDQQIHVLNGLISITLDSAAGYAEAAKDAKNPHFKSMFGARAIERRQIAAELKVEVRGLGGEPTDDGTLLAAGHRMFLNLKSALTGSDEGVVNEVESGEDHIKSKYESSLKEDCLSAPIKLVVAKAYNAVKSEHDDIRDLKHDLAARAATNSGVDASL